MTLSARNQLKGTVISVEKGIITAKEAVEDLGLKEGDEVTVVVKATDVMVFK
ncbi:MAG: TOBE domain-containing protein [Candidatus Aquicultor sp.]